MQHAAATYPGPAHLLRPRYTLCMRASGSLSGLRQHDTQCSYCEQHLSSASHLQGLPEHVPSCSTQRSIHPSRPERMGRQLKRPAGAHAAWLPCWQGPHVSHECCWPEVQQPLWWSISWRAQTMPRSSVMYHLQKKKSGQVSDGQGGGGGGREGSTSRPSIAITFRMPCCCSSGAAAGAACSNSKEGSERSHEASGLVTICRRSACLWDQ